MSLIIIRHTHAVKLGAANAGRARHFVRVVQVQNEHPTTNIQHRTPNGCHSGGKWMFDVGCWLLDVPHFPLTHRKASGFLHHDAC
jgi:hypothetical protein